ncbi:MAG: LTA synthase family protein [Desulfobulbaceae bacterium]|nr:LTA synthase family protein [Desulfobulbaceae bacterium]
MPCRLTPQFAMPGLSRAVPDTACRYLSRMGSSRFGLLHLFLTAYTLYAFALRLLLIVRSWEQIHHSPMTLLTIFGLGLFYDLISGLYSAIPFTLYLILAPRALFVSRWNKILVFLFFFVFFYLLGFSSLAEWLFWDEFGTRFNFIAVDYLVYTHEVLGNIRESYPTTLLLSAVFMATTAAFLVFRKWIALPMAREKGGGRRPFRAHLRQGVIFLLLPLFAFVSVDTSFTETLPNNYEQELAENGLYQLFHAFRTNSLDYGTFYKTLDEPAVFNELHHLLKSANSTFTNHGSTDIERMITAKGVEQHPNVVLVMMESMSAEFMASFGNKEGLTPNLDRIAGDGLLFANFYATGTRTVRGMEAVTLSIPPTPGCSIVKRPNNDHLFSLGSLFKEKGYDTTFLYGGYGYFDNMNDFFSGNGFDIVDRSALSKEEITFANIWGVCDEDLYRRAIKEFDRSHNNGKPFLGYLMTTSNHRPYTYPEGKIDIPSQTGRAGGVKYADAAIGLFLKEARQHPWFDNTVFVFVADHCAASAGREQLPLYRYHIPAIIYGPGIIKPAVNHTLASQVDLTPTLLGLMHWNYRSKLFGRDILQPDFPPRALIGNYQKLGYLKEGYLTILNERKQLHQYRIIKEEMQDTVVVEESPVKEELGREAISYYQGASLIYKNNLYGWQ